MKDPHDKATPDLIGKPKRGRPRSGSAKTQAQLQREYRARKKAEGLPTPTQALAGFVLWELPPRPKKWRVISGEYPLSWAAVNALASELSELHPTTEYKIEGATNADG